ncbi:ATP phosphoribosyltransferase regulatory subunit, partial [Rhizobium ruizarguesonis]
LSNADARAIGDATGILARLLPGRRLSVTLGDQAVFEAVFQALGLPLGWQKRLSHAFGNMTQLEALRASLVSPKFVTGLDDDIARRVARCDKP